MSSRQYLRSCRRDLVERRSAPIREQEIPDSANERAAIGNAGRSDRYDQRAIVCAREPRTKILSIVTAKSRIPSRHPLPIFNHICSLLLRSIDTDALLMIEFHNHYKCRTSIILTDKKNRKILKNR